MSPVTSVSSDMFTSSLIMKCLLLVFCICFFFGVVRSQRPSLKFNAVTTLSTGGTALLETSTASLLACAVECAKNIECEMSHFVGETKICTLIHHIITKPAGLADNTNLMKTPIPLFIVEGAFEFNGASDACADYGATLAHYAQIEDAFNAGWLHYNCGFISSGTRYYAFQYLVEDVGNVGITICSSVSSTGAAFCKLG